MTVLDFAGKNLALLFITHELADGQRPPYVHLASTNVIHVIGVPRPSPLFVLFCFRVLTEQKLKNKKRGRPGKEANVRACELPGWQ